MAELDLHSLETKWQKYWDTEQIHKYHSDSKKPLYSIDTPPPTVSGKMHLGHALGYSQADVIARYKKMQGHELFYPFGFDDNGLATERFVEKETGKRAVDMTRAEFVKLCLDTTKQAETELEKDFRALGLAIDWNLVYRTIDSKAVKIAQESFLDLFEQKRVYQSQTPHMYCTQCRTAIAQAELEDTEKESFFNDLEFELENKQKIMISTTRPELLPACVAIFIHPEDKRHKTLIGQTAIVPLFEQKVQILADKRVDPEKGSGIVMCCTFGDQKDMEWQKAYQLPIKVAIGLNGKMQDWVPEYAGLNIKQAREKIIQTLKEKEILKTQKKIMHIVNVHERCKTDVEFLVTPQWFIQYLDLKKQFLEASKSLDWNPTHMQVRLENWVQGLQWDWCISRQRYFGVPFPLWYCTQCKYPKIAEHTQLPVDPLQDQPIGVCEKCSGKEFTPEKDVLDTWFTSSLTPQINSSWTVNEKHFEKLFPMSLRPQGHDIITLWAFNTLVKSFFHHKQVPWQTVMINGFALDANGKKMSKSIGNVIAPQQIIVQYSADCLRYWTCSVGLGEDVPYKEKELVSGKRLLFKLWNAGKLIEGLTENFDYGNAPKHTLNLQIEDKWILSKLNNLIEKCTEQMNAFNFARTLAETRDFFWLEFCDYYLEEIKGRIYEPKTVEDQQAAQYTAVHVFEQILKLLAPILPHITEELYMESKIIGFKKEKSIHESNWPKIEKEKIDMHAEQTGKTMNQVIAGIRKYKSLKGLPMNSEVKKVTIYLQNNAFKEQILESQTCIQRTCKVLTLDVRLADPVNVVQVHEVNEDIKIEIE
ncbi:MAG: valine--tRNA ligase [Candidatus Diapherotrites archaeon]|nr:valine--tRNA ligase [Candidatus Diapherotrites archaeon]